MFCVRLIDAWYLLIVFSVFISVLTWVFEITSTYESEVQKYMITRLINF